MLISTDSSHFGAAMCIRAGCIKSSHILSMFNFKESAKARTTITWLSEERWGLGSTVYVRVCLHVCVSRCGERKCVDGILVSWRSFLMSRLQYLSAIKIYLFLYYLPNWFHYICIKLTVTLWCHKSLVCWSFGVNYSFTWIGCCVSWLNL